MAKDNRQTQEKQTAFVLDEKASSYEYRQRGQKPVDKGPPITLVFLISAENIEELASSVKALLRYLEENPDTDSGDVAHNLCLRQVHGPFRIATSTDSVSKLRDFLRFSLSSVSGIKSIAPKVPSVVMTFSGQAFFHPGRQLYGRIPSYRADVQHLDLTVQKLGSSSVLSIFEDSSEEYDGKDATRLLSPLTMQVATVIVQISLLRFWKRLGIFPHAVVGHSLGEYAALVAAGVLSAEDAIALVIKRAQLMTKLCTLGSHSMLAVRAGVTAVKSCIGETYAYDIAAYHSTQDIVITGVRQDIIPIQSSLEEAEISTRLMEVPFAFHSSQMDPVLARFREDAANITFKAPNIPYISPTIRGCILPTEVIDSSYVALACREAVCLVDALDAARGEGIVDGSTVWLDIGTHPACTTYVRKWAASAGIQATTFASLFLEEDNMVTLATSLAGLYSLGLPVCWEEYLSSWENPHPLLELPKEFVSDVNV